MCRSVGTSVVEKCWGNAVWRKCWEECSASRKEVVGSSVVENSFKGVSRRSVGKSVVEERLGRSVGEECCGRKCSGALGGVLGRSVVEKMLERSVGISKGCCGEVLGRVLRRKCCRDVLGRVLSRPRDPIPAKDFWKALLAVLPTSQIFPHLSGEGC